MSFRPDPLRPTESELNFEQGPLGRKKKRGKPTMEPFGSPPRGAFSGASFGSYWSPLRGTRTRSRLAAPPSPLRGQPTASDLSAYLPLRSSLGSTSGDRPRATEDPLSASSVYDAIAKAERRAREAEQWAKETVADVRSELSQQRQAMDESRRMANEFSAVASAEASHKAQSLGQERYRAVTDAGQRVEELQSAAVQAVNDAREDALSRISQMSAAMRPAAAGSQTLAAAPQTTVQPRAVAREGSAVDMLHAAAAAGRASTVVQYLEKVSDPNVLDGRGRTPLWLAASRGHSAVVVVLAENGASPGLACNGMTPAYSAAGLGHTHVLLILSGLGADMETPDVNGITPVSIAGHQGHLDAVRLLVNLGVNLEAASDNGATPFWSACRAGHLEVAKLLSSRGVDVRAPARNRTPREIASTCGHMSIVELIDRLTAAEIVATGTADEASATSAPLVVPQAAPQAAPHVEPQMASPGRPQPLPLASLPVAASPNAVPKDSTAMQFPDKAVVLPQILGDANPMIDGLLSAQQQLQIQLAQQQQQLQLMQQRVEQQQQQLHDQQLHLQKKTHEQRELQHQHEKARLEAEQRARLEQEELRAGKTREPRAAPAGSAELMGSVTESGAIASQQLQLQQLLMQEQLLLLLEHRRAGIFGNRLAPEPEQAPLNNQILSQAQPVTPHTASLNQLLGSMDSAKGELASLQDSELAHRQVLTQRKPTDSSTQWSPPPDPQAQHGERTAAQQYSPPHLASSVGNQWSPPAEPSVKHTQGLNLRAKPDVPVLEGGATGAADDSDSPEKWRKPRPSSAPVVRVPSPAAPAREHKVPAAAVEAWAREGVRSDSPSQGRSTPVHSPRSKTHQMPEQPQPTTEHWARIVAGDHDEMARQGATRRNSLALVDCCEDEKGITEKRESKAPSEPRRSPDSALQSQTPDSTVPAFLTELTQHDHADQEISQPQRNSTITEAPATSEPALTPTSATMMPDVPTVGARAKQTASRKPLNEEMSLELKEAAASMLRLACAISDRFTDITSAGSLAQALEQVIGSRSSAAVATHVNACATYTQELVKELKTENQKVQTQASAHASQTTKTSAEQNALKEKLAGATESLKSRIREREADEATVAALLTQRVETQSSRSDRQLRDQLQRELDDAIVQAQENAVNTVTAAETNAAEHEKARQLAEEALEKAKREAETGGRKLVSETQASLHAVQLEAQKAEDAAEHAVRQAAGQANELEQVKQSLAVAQQDNMARVAEQTRMENDQNLKRTKLALEEAQAKHEATIAQFAEAKKMIERSKEDKRVRTQEKEKLDVSAKLNRETQRKAHVVEMDSLRQHLQNEGDRACDALRQSAKEDIAAANRARDEANQRLNDAESQLKAVKMDFDATKARVEKEDRAARDASQRSHATQLAESISEARSRREDAERVAIQYEHQLKGVENEAKVATEDVASLEYQITTVQEAANAQREEKQAAAEALETLRGQFQQITAELELSFDDMQSSGNPQDRRAEIQQLREDDADARREILELEAELRDITVQNDQLQRKVQNIQRELVATQGPVGGGIGQGVGVGMGGGGLMDARQAAVQQKASVAGIGGGPAGRGIEGNPGARPRPSSGVVDFTKPLERPEREGGNRRNVPPQASGPAPRPRQGDAPGSTSNVGRSGRTVEEVLCVGSRWKGHIDRDGRKVMYSLKVTREEAGGKNAGGLGNLVGMHTLLTSNNVVTIKPLPDIPGLIRIAEKAKGGIECIVRVMP